MDLCLYLTTSGFLRRSPSAGQPHLVLLSLPWLHTTSLDLLNKRCHCTAIHTCPRASIPLSRGGPCTHPATQLPTDAGARRKDGRLCRVSLRSDRGNSAGQGYLHQGHPAACPQVGLCLGSMFLFPHKAT